MRRYLAALLAAAICVLSACGTAGAAHINGAAELDASAGVVVSHDPSDYTNGEVLVGYADGTFAVLTYENDEALSAGLEELASAEDVILVQPNYTYDSSAFSTQDALTAQQWALSNDGTFHMEEQKNQYPVYDTPFGTPSASGQWTMPQNRGTTGGIPGSFRRQSYVSAASTAQTAAVAGIDINAKEAWAVYDGGSQDVIIALIDTGVDYTHEDLQNVIWVNEDEIPGNGIDDDGNGYIDDVYGWNFYSNNNQVYVGSEDSHGTHGAGTIAAQANNGVGIAGIVQSDHVKIMVLKALGGSDGSGTTASVIQAIQYAEANGASICSLSLGSSTNDRALYQAISNSSMLFVVAAGNDGADTDASPCYPASYDLDNIISVANLNYDGTLHDSSNYGAVSVDLAAPGSYILSTTPGDGYSYMTGTSMAAPMVTAAAAMVYSYYTDITLADVKEILLSSVQTLDTLDGLTATGGMLNLGAAMTYDLSALSRTGWTQSASTGGTGSAPEIQTSMVTRQGQAYLVVQITDADSDLSVTAYAAGALSAAQFSGGSAGQSFTLGGDGTATFSVTSSGIYTFYAADSAGNETVKTISVASESTGTSSGGAHSPSRLARTTSPRFPSFRKEGMR